MTASTLASVGLAQAHPNHKQMENGVHKAIHPNHAESMLLYTVRIWLQTV